MLVKIEEAAEWWNSYFCRIVSRLLHTNVLEHDRVPWELRGEYPTYE